jgi:P4 family phage/plasmid primase-like protien
MIKISELNLKKLLLTVRPSDKKSGKTYINIESKWNLMTYEELETINRQRIKDTNNNQYFIMLNREYMVIDTDEERPYNLLVKYLKENDLYNEDAITKSYKGKMKNIYYKRHFWFKVNNQRQFKHIKTEGQIDFLGGEIFFGNSGFIGEWAESTINNIPEIDISLYNDLTDLLNEPELKSKENEKINIEFSEDEEEEKHEEKREIVKTQKTQKTINTIFNNKSNDELIQLLNGLAEKRYLKYKYWIVIYFIFKNENYDLALFEEFSKKSKYYNKQENDKILNKIMPKKGYSIATLYFWLKKDNIKLFTEMCKNREDFWNLRINNISIADFYFQLNPDDFIFTYGNGWYEYTENNILVNRGEIPINLICGMGRKLQQIATEQRNFITPEHPKYKQYMDFYNKFYDKVGQTDFIKSTITQLQQAYYKDIVKELNNINLFAFNNILYDNKINEYRNIEKSDYITLTTGYDLEYKIINNKIVPNRNNNIITKIKEFLYTLFENDELVNYWLNITAVSLFGNDKQQKLYIFSGKGSNGKSLTQKLINLALGQYYKSVSNNFFVGSIKKGGADAELAGCQGIRYLSVSEPDESEGKKFNISNLKNYSGGDKLQARGLYEKKMVEFYAQFTIFINCNDLPELSNVDDGIKRRVRNIFFPFQFKEQKELKNNKNFRLININLGQELVKSEFIQNFIIMLLEISKINKDKLIDTPESVLENSNKYCDENNILYNWFNETFIKTTDPKDRHKSSDLMNSFNNSEHCKKKLSPKDFSKLMEKLGLENKKIHNVSYYTNISYLMNEENDLD